MITSKEALVKQGSSKLPIILTESQKHLKFDRRRFSANSSQTEEPISIVNLEIQKNSENSEIVVQEDGENNTSDQIDKKQRLEDIIKKYGRSN